MRNYAYPPLADASDLFDILRGTRESATVTTFKGERFRAYRDGRGFVFLAGRRVVCLDSVKALDRYVDRLRSAPDACESSDRLADLLDAVRGAA